MMEVGEVKTPRQKMLPFRLSRGSEKKNYIFFTEVSSLTGVFARCIITLHHQVDIR